ncbi:MAG: MFS transporter [Lachnospiraceae bacterium]|nr:MFS transporter [Lachnospiraceae bacterium]
MNRSIKVGISIFAIAMAFGLNITGIVPVLNLVRERYSDQSTSVVQLMQTLPYAFLMVGSLIIGWLTTRMTKKNIALLAAAVIGVCGTLPFLSESFTVLFISRLLIGFGFGLAGPVITAIIAEFIPVENRASYLGINVVGMGIGAMAGNLIGGLLAKSGLRYFYLVYLMAFISLAVILLLLPRGTISERNSRSVRKLNAMVYILAVTAFLHTLFVNAYSSNIGMHIAREITSDTGAAGIVTAVSSVSSLLMGVLFSKITKLLKRATLPFAVFSAAAAYAVILFIPGMPGAVISSFLTGVSISCFNAMGGYLTSILVRQEAVAKASGLFSIFGGIGGLISPIVLGGISSSVLSGNTPRNQFSIALAGMILLGAAISLIILKGFGEPKEAA